VPQCGARGSYTPPFRFGSAMTHGLTAALALAVLGLQTIKASRHGKQNIDDDNPRALLTDIDVRIIRGGSEGIRTRPSRWMC